MKGLKTRYRLTFQPDFKEWPKATLRRGMEAANVAIGKLWFGERLERHFTNTARQEYAYAPRKKDYQIAKASLEGRTQPLVGISRGPHQAGQLQRQVMRTGLVRATSTRVVVQMEAPNYVRQRSRGGSGPDLVEEITAISEQETRLFVTLYERLLTRIMEREPKRKRVRAGG